MPGRGSLGALLPARMPSPATWVAVAMFGAALLLRWPSFGDPAFNIDEEFYLLVGDRLLHGALPYVDIWDRKPIGLFLLYAAIRLLGGDGVYQYQIVATLFAGGTAAVIAGIACRPAGLIGGTVAGLAYLLWIETVEGGGGQSPIFYNLFIAGAAAGILRAAEEQDRRRFRMLGFGAMVLVGVAIQVKYTAVFEGCYFGLLLAWWTLRRERPAPAMAWTLALALTALAPTLAAIAAYAAIGQLDAFWFANFISIFLRAPGNPAELHHRLWQMGLHAVPFVLCIAAGVHHLRTVERPEVRRWQWIVAGWTIAALVGFFSIGGLYFHYMLPLFVPLSVAAAPGFRRWPLGPVLAGLLLWLPLSHLHYPGTDATARSRARIAKLTALIPADVDRGCMQMFAGPPILYKITRACLVTPYIFPDHLLAAREAPAIGVDQAIELRRAMARRPRVVVTSDTPWGWNPSSEAALRQVRDGHYRRVGRVLFDGYPCDVWVLPTPASR